MELEADNRGITEILEKKSLELDLPVPNSLKENRHPKKVKRHRSVGSTTNYNTFSESCGSLNLAKIILNFRYIHSSYI